MPENFEEKIKNQTTEPMLNSEQDSAPLITESEVMSHKPGKIKEFWDTSSGFVKANPLTVALFGIGVLLILILGYIALKPSAPEKAQEADIQISTEIPATTGSGSEVIYKITLQNNDSTALQAGRLELAYGTGVTYVSSQPAAENLTGTLLAIPALEPGRSVTAFVKTLVTGEINQRRDLNLKYYYKFQNGNLEFAKVATASLTIAAADLEVSMSGAQSANTVTNFEYIISYSNNASESVGPLRIQVDYPAGFTFVDAQPAPDIENNTWTINAPLKSGEKGTIKFKGNFAGIQTGQQLTFKTTSLVAGGDNITYYPQSSSAYVVTISGVPITVQQQLLSPQGATVLEPGAEVRVGVDFKNTGTVAVSGVGLIAAIDPTGIEPGSLKSESGAVKDLSVSWNASTVRQLERLNPGEGGRVEYIFRLKDPIALTSTQNITVKTNVKIKSNEFTDFFAGNELSFKVSSPTYFETTLEQTSGAWAMKVGQSTGFTVTMKLFNSSNLLKNGTLEFYIPNGVQYVSQNGSSGGSLQYDSNTGKATWTVGEVGAWSGVFSEPKQISFTVSVTPNSTSANNTITVLKDLVYSAQDSFTAQNTSSSLQEVKTNQAINAKTGNDGKVSN